MRDRVWLEVRAALFASWLLLEPVVTRVVVEVRGVARGQRIARR